VAGDRTAQVSLEAVSKTFGTTTAVDSLTLDALDGELLVLLGPSGCGKSTVLRLVAGLEEPTGGTIRIGGQSVDGVDAKDRDIAMVFQSYALYPHLSVRRNIEFPLRARHVEAAARGAAVAEVARTLQLEALLDRRPSQLSGGQRQRVALARAMVRRPRAFLMDEPLSNLDAQLRQETRAELVELQRRLATTFIYVTHDQVEAMTMGSRIAILAAGQLQQVGTPRQVHDKPASTFVAGFIGNPPMNLLPGRLVADGDLLAVELAGDPAGLGGAPGVASRIEIGAATARALGSGAPPEVIVGVRPEHLRIDPAGIIAATVTLVEALGHEYHVGCRTDGGSAVIVRVSDPSSVPHLGDKVTLAVTGPVHLFERGSPGRRIGDDA
jgi:multiple sugar transport system ATP-binding protein